MPFKIIRDDITNVKADVIVNTANPHPIYASGTDAAIYKAAGAEQLLTERKKIGEIGPAWIDGKHGEFDILTDCYENSLAKAVESQPEAVFQNPLQRKLQAQKENGACTCDSAGAEYR